MGGHTATRDRDIEDIQAAGPPEDRAQFRGIKPARAWQILGGAVVAYETMRSLRVEQAEVSPWALREGIVLEHLAAVRGPGERLTLQPLTFNESVDSATITALPDSRMAPAREPT